MWSHFEPGGSTVDLDAVVVDGGTAVVLSTFTHVFAHNGARFTTPSAMRFDVVDGEIARMQLFEDTAAVSRAYFASS